MPSYNKAILIGHLCADPELKSTKSGVPVTSFRIAVNRKKSEETDYITVVAWRNTAEFICKYFQKGKPILVTGSIQTRSWKDETGSNRYSTEIVAEEVDFVASKGSSESTESVGVWEEGTDEDLPF